MAVKFVCPGGKVKWGCVVAQPGWLYSGMAGVVVLWVYNDAWGKLTRTEGHLSLPPFGVRSELSSFPQANTGWTAVGVAEHQVEPLAGSFHYKDCI